MRRVEVTMSDAEIEILIEAVESLQVAHRKLDGPRPNADLVAKMLSELKEIRDRK